MIGAATAGGDVDLQFASLPFVLPRKPDEEHDHDRDEHDDEPRAVGELRDGDDHVDDSDSTAPMPLTKSPHRQPGSFLREVVLGHAGLGERERREHADRVERDQAVDLGPGDARAGRSTPRPGR